MVVNQEKWENLRIPDILSPSLIRAEVTASTKKGVIEELVEMLVKEGRVKDLRMTVDVLMEREKVGTTGIGQGIAIPHAKTDQATDVVAALGISRRGIQFDSLDEEPVHIIFMLVAPTTATGPHLVALARISRLLKNKFFRQALRDMRDPAEILKRIREEDQY